ncbi:DNA polymerase III subunit delta [Bacillus sp. CGMCC 1.16607]|uniref:DNA polymerase III subunit delta n=1 Tax=Bacillus sp. CGMCC 1.16607 TaxID=3351842 RepID=UPI003636DDD6
MIIDIWKQIKKGEFAQLYLLYGSESFLIHETIQLLINHVLNEDEKDFNLSTYDLEEIPIEVALEDAETFPFLGEKRLIILQNPVFLTSEKTKEKVEHNISKLELYISNPPPYSIVVLAAPYEKLDERKKITKELKRNAVMGEAKKLNDQELRNWIKDRISVNGVQMEEKALDKMIAIAGTNLFVLTNEIDKMSLYVGNEKKIDLQTVEKLVSKTLEQNIFELVDKVVHRKTEDALRIYYDLLKQNEEPLKILALLAGQFRLIYQVKELARKGYGQQQIASAIKQHPYRVKLAAGQASLFTDKELVEMMRLFAEADYQMKTGSLNKTMIIEMIFFKLNSLS